MVERFAFGENWEDFSKSLQYKDYLAAKESLEKLIPNLKDKTFLDVGCGSGLFSIAAGALGAKKVLGFDMDTDSISASKQLLEKISKWDPDVGKVPIEFKIESILNKKIDLEKYDNVYSWGVLHHTGDMHKAFSAIINLVAEKGTLVIAIYNKHFTSPVWKIIKYTYVKSPKFVKKILVFTSLIAKLLAALVFSRRNPFKKTAACTTTPMSWIGWADIPMNMPRPKRLPSSLRIADSG